MRKPILAVSGVKNSGKTSLLEKLIPALTARGLRTAVIKHDGHRFSPDRPGTDSFRMLEAGACGAAVFDDEKLQLVKYAAVTEKELAALCPEADLILLEGFKYSCYKKIEVVPAGCAPVCDPGTLLALVTEGGPALPGVSCFGREETEALAGLVYRWWEREREENSPASLP